MCGRMHAIGRVVAPSTSTARRRPSGASIGRWGEQPDGRVFFCSHQATPMSSTTPVDARNDEQGLDSARTAVPPRHQKRSRNQTYFRQYGLYKSHGKDDGVAYRAKAFQYGAYIQGLAQSFTESKPSFTIFAVAQLDSMVRDLVERIGTEAGRMMKLAKRTTFSMHDATLAIEMLMRPEVAQSDVFATNKSNGLVKEKLGRTTKNETVKLVDIEVEIQGGQADEDVKTLKGINAMLDKTDVLNMSVINEVLDILAYYVAQGVTALPRTSVNYK